MLHLAGKVLAEYPDRYFGEADGAAVLLVSSPLSRKLLAQVLYPFLVAL
jgi:hypothetical protein